MKANIHQIARLLSKDKLQSINPPSPMMNENGPIQFLGPSNYCILFNNSRDDKQSQPTRAAYRPYLTV
jgi:hypothetical protein